MIDSSSVSTGAGPVLGTAAAVAVAAIVFVGSAAGSTPWDLYRHIPRADTEVAVVDVVDVVAAAAAASWRSTVGQRVREERIRHRCLESARRRWPRGR